MAGELLYIIDKRHHGGKREPRTKRGSKTEGTVVTLPLPKHLDQALECEWAAPTSLADAAKQASTTYGEMQGLVEKVVAKGVRLGKTLNWAREEHKRQGLRDFVNWLEEVRIPSSTAYMYMDLADDETELRSRSEDLSGLLLTEEVNRIRAKKRAVKKPKAPPKIDWADSYDPPDKERWFDTTSDLWSLDKLWLATKMDWKDIVKEDGVTGVRAHAIGEGTPYNDKFSVFPGVLPEFVYQRGLNGPPARILDPCAGGAVRGVVAATMGYEYHGIDIWPALIAENEDRCQGGPSNLHYYVGDGTRAGDYVDRPFDLLFTCPPFHDKEKYSCCEGDLSARETYDEYIEDMGRMARNARPLMKSGARVYLVLGHVRDPSTEPPRRYVDLAHDVTKQFEVAGFKYQHRLVIKFPDGRAAASAGGSWKVHQHYYPVTQTLSYLRAP